MLLKEAWKKLIKIFVEKRRLREGYKDFEVKRRMKKGYKDFAVKKEAWKKVIKILLKRSLKEGNKDKKEGSEENKRSFYSYK